MLSLLNISDQQEGLPRISPNDNVFERTNLTGLKEKTCAPMQNVMQKTSRKIQMSASAARTRKTGSATWITKKWRSCAANMAKRGHPCVAKPQLSLDRSSASSREDTTTKSGSESLGLENLFSIPEEEETNKEGVSIAEDEVSSVRTFRKCPIEVKSATMHMLLPPLPDAAPTNSVEEKEKQDEASASPGGGLSEERKSEDAESLENRASPSGKMEQSNASTSSTSRSATELARTTWVLFPNGKYQIFVDYPNGLRVVFLSAPGAIYKPGPHQFFVPTGGDLSRHGLVVPRDMVHLLLPLGIKVKQQQRSPAPLAVPVTSPVICR